MPGIAPAVARVRSVSPPPAVRRASPAQNQSSAAARRVPRHGQPDLGLRIGSGVSSRVRCDHSQRRPAAKPLLPFSSRPCLTIPTVPQRPSRRGRSTTFSPISASSPARHGSRAAVLRTHVGRHRPRARSPLLPLRPCPSSTTTYRADAEHLLPHQSIKPLPTTPVDYNRSSAGCSSAADRRRRRRSNR